MLWQRREQGFREHQPMSGKASGGAVVGSGLQHLLSFQVRRRLQLPFLQPGVWAGRALPRRSSWDQVRACTGTFGFL